MVTYRERWDRLRSCLWQPPRAHGEQPHERAVGPLELFYDLAVVVLVTQDARHLALHLTWRALGQFAAMFTLAWIAWATVASTTNCTATTMPGAAARSCFRSWCWSRWAPSPPRRTAPGERRSPSPRRCCSRY